MMKKLFYLMMCVALFADCRGGKDGKDGKDGKNGKDYEEKAVSGFPFEMVYVQGGTFQMGADDWEYDNDELPVHVVTLSDYYIGKHEVTQGLWKAVMGTGVEEQIEKLEPEEKQGLKGVGDNYPMYYVNWDEAQEFVRKLSELTGKKYVLPTEAQWEYAARGGAKSKKFKYSGSNKIDNVAWYLENCETGSNHPVGTKAPNELGIYDMSGSVWEWCSDWYDGEYYANSPQTNPAGPASGPGRVGRGGSFANDAWSCQVFHRDGSYPLCRAFRLGFRVAMVP